MKLAIIPFAALLTASALAGATPTSRTNLDDKTYGSWGVDLSARDLSVRPGDDFDSYAGPYEELRRLVQARLKAIIVDSGATSPIGALYRSFLDDSVVERLDKVPLESGMSEIAALSDKRSLARWMGGSSLARWQGGPFGRYGLSLFQVSTDFDPDDASTMTAAIYQRGLGLPDRDYYLLERFKPQREAYLAYIERALAMGGVPQARDRAQQVMAFESAIAKVSYSRADSRDPAKSINRSTIAAVERDNPGFPWREFIQAAGIEVVPTTRIIVREKDAIHR